jgi:hypothetical protein
VLLEVVQTSNTAWRQCGLKSGAGTQNARKIQLAVSASSPAEFCHTGYDNRNQREMSLT